MGVNVTTRQTAPPQRVPAQRSTLNLPSCAGCVAPSPIHRLQRAIGNRALTSVLRAPTIQAKLKVSHPEDESEREADRVADEVMRMPDTTVQRKCDCGEGNTTCEQCSTDAGTLARKPIVAAAETSVARTIYRKEDFGETPDNVCVGEGGDEELEMLLTQIADRTDQNLELRQKIDMLPQTSSNERDTLSQSLDDGRTELIGLLERRSILLKAAILDLRLEFQSKPMICGPDDPPVAEQVFFKLNRYERELKEHEVQLRPLLRLQMRQQIATIDEQVAEIDKELALLPPVSDPNAPDAELLALKRAELIEQRKTLVKSLVSGAVEYKQFDERWGATRYGNDKKCTNITEAGCGPSTLAILLNYLYAEDPESLTGGSIEFVTPKETAVYAATHGRVCNSGTAGDTMVTQVATQWPGFRGKRINLEAAITELRSGNLVIFLCKNCTGKKSGDKGGDRKYEGHFMVLSGVDDAGTTFNVLDPGSAETKDINTISKKELSTHTNGFWIVERK